MTQLFPKLGTFLIPEEKESCSHQGAAAHSGLDREENRRLINNVYSSWVVAQRSWGCENISVPKGGS